MWDQRLLNLCTTVLLTGTVAFVADAAEYRPRVGVREPTRLDWSFAVAEKSLANPPAEWVRHAYNSNKQTYEFFGPGERDNVSDNERMPLILFVSPKGKAIGWKHWEPVCRQHGILFAGPNGTFKGIEDSLRIRIAMDVLDDVRRRFPIDPDRTYIAGFYGGARVAAKIAYRLPEYFGGVVPIAGGVVPPDTLWIRQPMIDRLSVVHLVGERDQPGPGNQRVGMTRLLHRDLVNSQTRTQRITYPGTVDKMPRASQLEAAILWLEQDLPRRRALANDYASTSMENATTRKDHATMMLDDAKTRFQFEKERCSAWLMLEAVRQRWPDLAMAASAKTTAIEFEKHDGPWKQERDKLRHQLLQEQTAAIRPKQEVDLRRGEFTFPPEYADTRHWIEPRDEPAAEPGNYDAATLAVIKRLSNRVTLNADGRVNFIDLSGTRVTTPQMRNFKNQLQGMQELLAIDLSATVMRETTLSQIADLNKIQSLDLANTDTTNRGLTHLSRYNDLRFLSLASTSVNSHGLKQIGSLKSLRGINLSGTRIDDAAVDQLCEADLQVLSLAATRVTDAAASKLASLQSLVYLDLGSTSVGDRSCQVVGKLERLQRLVLNHTRVTDDGVTHLAGLPDLEELKLIGTAISDDGMRTLYGMHGLRRLNVRSTKVTAAGVRAAAETNGKIELKWDGNRTIGVEKQKALLEKQNQSAEQLPADGV